MPTSDGFGWRATGRRLWSRDLTDDGATLPEWGFAASPLVIGDLVVVVADGAAGRELAAYDAASGEPRWTAPAGPYSYSSAHPAVLDGEPQVLVLTSEGATAVAPADGAVLWRHSWPLAGPRIVQPAVTGGDVLIGTGFGEGLRRIAVRRSGGAWQTEELWTSSHLKPYFNDLVVHRDHVYGFDGRILTCLRLADGERMWKGGRYGNGQLLLLPDQDLVLVLSDRGELALVRAHPAAFEELARRPALSGKTWNHPAIAGGVLFVRNSEEMAAFRLPLADGSAAGPSADP